MTRMSEWISALSPTTATEIALVIFMSVFALVAWRHGRRSANAGHLAASLLPLEDDAVVPSAGGTHGR